ncbi:hypothetical protein [Lysobacter soli]|uniref:hypothetical protein n=1 Tax=Lysobacter soli TaxID=453783 RepID=UPI0024104E33|nr:hypothetical protein [Lysobacter soli]MDG2517549.1 hypothetical protein [Lysobacter soli]
MKRDAFRAAVVLFAMFASAAATAQDEAESPALDLSVPAERIHFASTDPDVNYGNDPPGAWRPITPAEVEASTKNDWQVHGAVEAGIGYSKNTGTSNWQAVNLNLDKTYTTDDGDTNHVNIDINVGHSDGPVFGPGAVYSPGYYGPSPMPAPMRARGPFVR